ncbi:ArsR family transcriptional regulator [Paenibacillus contaminans]|uniref:ArsR family transcriptional regulator n=1 Tax=Paenibacillus contaminans TaxID=450362 RepID=A0A329MM15_9BACL|nr:helix-turn-helix domain-containing protein [Paenibacillus contaminans]RAV20919.1 ArsR family transcriptional regulator [Paenibacillus contaminans]
MSLHHADDLSTRKNIVRLLKTEGPLTTSQIKKRVHITDAAVRRHINALEKQHMIRSETIYQAIGRPAFLYRLTEESERLFPAGYHFLAAELLEELIHETGAGTVDRIFINRTETLLRKYEPEMQGKPLKDKVALLADIQDRNGFMAWWTENDTESGRFELIEHHCPVSYIANRYEQVCREELKLFEALLDADVERTDCMAVKGRKCIYHIRERT